MNKPAVFAFLASASLAGFMPAHADIAARADVAAFIQSLAGRRHWDAAELSKLFQQVDIQRKIIDTMDRPAESKPWWEYRKILLTEAHIQGGVAFWRQNRAALDEASSRYGVAPEMIVAIIGAESRYGQTLGNYRVIDALSTLAFEYPRRGEYFRKELEEYLLMCREESIDPARPHGSYAGAMGMPQFMPSSYRLYAVDLDGDRKRNIWTNPTDAIASVANYFAHAGWRKNEPVAAPAKINGEGFRRLLEATATEYSIAELRGLGVEPLEPLPAIAQARLLSLETQTGPEYWLVLHNFSVITRYNHSPLYAMAAFLLGREILARRGG
jgi:membrane-bound lytic murein transglycosylase B